MTEVKENIEKMDSEVTNEELTPAKVEVEASQFGQEHPEHYGTDRKLKIYYDETNNFGKLKLSDAGLNVSKSDNFVLGGIAITEEQELGDIDEFRKLLRIQANAPEVKFEMVAHGAFEKMLGSSKLNNVLKWLLERDIKIHYSNLNILNWFILEIIESIIAHEDFISYGAMHFELKNELHHIATSDLPSFLSLINKYNYPNIEKEQTSAFLKDLYEFICKNWPETPFVPTDALKEIILRARVIPELDFLVNNNPGELIDGIDSFFLNRICTFKNSTHIFDQEESVIEAIGNYRITHNGNEIPFCFVDSKKHFGTQLSDIITGFLGKYFSLIEKTPTKTLINIKKNLNQAQKNNITALANLIENSDSLSNALLHRITTIDSNNKSDFFLFDSPLSPHLKSTNR